MPAADLSTISIGLMGATSAMVFARMGGVSSKAKRSIILPAVCGAIASVFARRLLQRLVQKMRAAPALKDEQGPEPDMIKVALDSRDVNTLQKIVSGGEKDGIKKEDVEQAGKALEEWKVNARSALAKAIAMEATGRDTMQAALKEGESVGLDEPELAKCREAIALAEEAEKKQVAARACIAEAIRGGGSGGVQKMQQALKEGEDAGLEEAELVECRQAIALAEDAKKKAVDAKKKADACDAIAKAVKSVASDRLHLMQKALKVGEAAGLEDSQLASCRQAIEQAEGQAKKEADAFDAITKAVKSGAIDAMRKALGEGEVAGLGEAKLVQCREAIAKETKKVAARAAITKAIESNTLDRHSYLQRVLKDGAAAGLDASELMDCQHAIAKEAVKVAARTAIAKALESQASNLLDVLHSALKDGMAAGLDELDLGKCRQAIAKEDQKVSARAAIAKAVKGKASNVRDLLQDALKEGVAAGLSDSELSDCRQAITKETKKAVARTSIANAIESNVKASNRLESLQSVIKLGEAAGLDGSELAKCRQAIAKEEKKIAARSAIAKAIESKASDRLGSLQGALKDAIAAGLEEQELASCQQAILLAEEEAKRAAARSAIAEAISSKAADRIDAMWKALKDGQSAGLSDTELSRCREAIAQAVTEEKKGAVRAQIAIAMESQSDDRSEKLQAALKAGEDIGLEQAELDACEVEIAAAKVEEAAQREAEAEKEEQVMQAHLSEKEERLGEVTRQRSFSSYLFGDPDLDAAGRETDEAKEKLHRAQEKRRSSLLDLHAEQVQLETLAKDKGVTSPSSRSGR